MKKLNKFVAVLVALAMMAALTVTSAFAALAPAEDEQKADYFVVTKNLEMPNGTKVPASTFKFTATATSESATDSPVITIPDIVFTGNESTTDNAAGNKVATKALTKAQNPFANLKTPGKYVYEVKETSGNNSENNEKYSYDEKVYTVRIYVDANGKQTYTITEKTDATSTDEKKDGAQKDADGVKYADAEFNNKYVKKTDVTPNGEKDDPTNDSTGYSFEKFIANDNGNLYKDKEWEFKVKVAKPALSEAKEYNYQIWNVGTGTEDETKATKASDGKITPDADYVSVTLKAGQRLVFTDLDIGAKVNVKETAVNDIKAEALLNNVNYDIANGDDTLVEQDAKEYLKVTNTSLKETGNEGILISNLPYIALALVAVGGLVAYVVVRRKNEDNA